MNKDRMTREGKDGKPRRRAIRENFENLAAARRSAAVSNYIRPWCCLDGTRGCDRLDDHLRLGQGIFIGQRHVDKDPVARRGEGGEPRRRAATHPLLFLTLKNSAGAVPMRK